MSTDTKETVIDRLKNYPALIQKRDILRFEMEHPAQVSEHEVLEAMSFLRGDGTGTHSSGMSDRTFYIASIYRENAAAMNSEVRSDIARRLLPLEREIERLEFYVNMLPEREEAVVRAVYFEGTNQQEVAKRMGISTWTVRKNLNDAVEKLTEMYAFAEGENDVLR